MNIEALGMVQDEAKLVNICKFLDAILTLDEDAVQHIGSQKKVSKP
jgi:hypothetical protein